MKTGRTISVVLITAIVMLFNLPCMASEKEHKDEPNTWFGFDEEPIEPGGPGGPDELRGPEEPRGPGGPEELKGPEERRGPRESRRQGRGPRRFDLTDEEIGRIISSLRENDPKKAEELERLRIEDPNKFQIELGRHGGEEFGRIVRERIERWRNQRRDEFLQWLEKNYSQDAKELAGLKEKDAKLYWEKFEIVSKKYWRIFEEEKRDPELADVLKEDLELRKNSEELIRKIKGTKDEKTRKELTEQLEEVISRRFDLIIRRKQIEYERLLRRVVELQKQLEESKLEISEWRDVDFKNENVKNRVKELLGSGTFKWD